MNIEQCASFEKCESPLCPLYEDNKYSVWYPDEEICVSRSHKPAWVKKQRRIKKVARDRDSHYTIEMLESIGRVTPQTRGLDAEGKRSEDAFLRRRNRPVAATLTPCLAPLTLYNKAVKGYNPHAMPKTTAGNKTEARRG